MAAFLPFTPHATFYILLFLIGSTEHPLITKLVKSTSYKQSASLLQHMIFPLYPTVSSCRTNQAKIKHTYLFKEIAGTVRQTRRRAYLCFSHWLWTACCFTWRGQEVTELCAVTLSFSLSLCVMHTFIHTGQLSKYKWLTVQKITKHTLFYRGNTLQHVMLWSGCYKGDSKKKKKTCQELDCNWAK